MSSNQIRINRPSRDLGDIVAEFLSGPPLQRADVVAVCRRLDLHQSETDQVVTEVMAGWNACDHWNGRAEGLHGASA